MATISMTGVQWRAFLDDPISWPGDSYVEECILVFRGEETDDLDDALVQDDDIVTIKEGYVRQPEPPYSIYATVDMVELAQKFMIRHLTVSQAVRVEPDRVAEALASGKAAKLKVECPYNPATAKARPKSLTLTGADWRDYLASEPPEWPSDGYVQDCIGKVDDKVVENDLDTEACAPHAIVKVESGSIEFNSGADGIDLVDHLAGWLSERKLVTLVVHARKERQDKLAEWISKIGGQVVEARPDPAAPVPSP